MRLAPGPRDMRRSGIREIMDLAGEGADVVRLEVGEPDFDTPAHVVEAAAEAARRGMTRYTPNAGIPELREALADKISTVNHVTAHPDDVVITQGAVEGIFSTLACLVQAGDEVLVPDPGWPNYRQMAIILGSTPVGYRLAQDDGYQADLDALEKAITAATKVIIVNSPSNPLGTILSAQCLRGLLDLAARHDLWVISDECYDQITFDDTFVSTASLSQDLDRVVSVYSFSKTYSMTGWRVGYALAPKGLRQTLTKVQEPIISCVNTPTQYAALAAVTGPQDTVRAHVAAYRERRDLVAALLTTSGARFVEPHGAFYLWLLAEDADADGADIARRLVTEHGVAVAPGPTFGTAGRHAVRISLATSPENLREGVARLLRSGLLVGPAASELGATSVTMSHGVHR
jgi:aspartate aminotransferase